MMTNPEADDAGVGADDGVMEPPRSFGTAIRQIGPGLILAAAIVGTGELIATTQAGAKAGFVLLWLVIASCFIKVFVQIELGRFAISTGSTTFKGFRSLGVVGSPLVWWCALMLLVTQLQIGTMIAGIGQAAHLALPGLSEGLAAALGMADRPELPWGIAITIITAGSLAAGGYRFIERFMTILVVGFTAMTVLCVGLLPEAAAIGWEQIAQGLQFRLPRDPEVVMAALAMFGITGVGATELLTYPYWCLEKGYARHVGPRDDSIAWADRARGWLRVMQLDAWVSMVIYTIATIAFFLLGAAVLHDPDVRAGLPDRVDTLIAALVTMYEPALGPVLARWFLVLGAIAVLFSTLFAATAGTGRLLADVLRVNDFYPDEPPEYRRRWVRLFCVALPVSGLLLYLAIGSPVTMVTTAGLMQAVTLPLIALATVRLRYARTDRRLTSGPLWDLLLWVSMIGLIGAGGYGVYIGAVKLGLAG